MALHTWHSYSSSSSPVFSLSSLSRSIRCTSWEQCCGSRIRIFPIPDPGSALKNLSILTPKNCFQALGNMIRVIYLRIPDPHILPIPDPGSRGQNGTGSWIRIRNTAWEPYIRAGIFGRVTGQKSISWN